jgi:hypothetical protein
LTANIPDWPGGYNKRQRDFKMQTLSEIIEACKSGLRPTVDEMRFAICAMDALSTLDSTTLSRRALNSPEIMRIFEASFNRWKNALSQPPDKYLGASHNPDNPENQRRREISKKIYAKISKR